MAKKKTENKVTRDIDLPHWATGTPDGVIEIDPDTAYPLVLDLLEIVNPDQYWLEVARRCVTEKLRLLHGPGLSLRILPKARKWSLGNFPEGMGAARGCDEFRKHWNRIKDQL